MKREQIEKAAGEYSGSILGFEQNLSVMDKHKAFSDGAQWRIESVWHDAEEQQENGRLLLCQSSIYPANIAGPNNDDFRDTAKEYNVTRWEYIDDLLPEGKED